MLFSNFLSILNFVSFWIVVFRRQSKLFFISAVKCDVIVESAFKINFCRGNTAGQKFLCFVKAFYGYVFPNGRACNTSENAVQLGFAHINGGTDIVKR